VRRRFAAKSRTNKETGGAPGAKPPEKPPAQVALRSRRFRPSLVCELFGTIPTVSPTLIDTASITTRITAIPEKIEPRSVIRGVLAPVLADYGVTFRIMHGFGSATAVHDVAQENDGRRLNVLHVGDSDPSGLWMSLRNLPERLSRYGGHHVKLKRIALTQHQLRGLTSFAASDKRKDPRYKWFVQNFGNHCWELDALDPNELRARRTDHLEAHRAGRMAALQSCGMRRAGIGACRHSAMGFAMTAAPSKQQQGGETKAPQPTESCGSPVNFAVRQRVPVARPRADCSSPSARTGLTAWPTGR
jgi:hypothetical protein